MSSRVLTQLISDLNINYNNLMNANKLLNEINKNILFYNLNKGIIHCELNELEIYLKTIFNARFSQTIPLLIADNTNKYIVKIYIFRKKLHKTTYNFNDIFHPLNIELQIIKYTQKILDDDLTPNLIRVIGNDMLCKNGKNQVINLLNMKCESFPSVWACGPTLVNWSNYFDDVRLQIVEFASGGIFSENTFAKMDDKYFIEMLFQIFYTVAILYHKHKIIHFDIKGGNILFCNDPQYDKNKDEYYEYNFNGISFYIKIREIIPKIWDYDASFYENIKNPFITDRPHHMLIYNAVNPNQVDLYQTYKKIDRDLKKFHQTLPTKISANILDYIANISVKPKKYLKGLTVLNYVEKEKIFNPLKVFIGQNIKKKYTYKI